MKSVNLNDGIENTFTYCKKNIIMIFFKKYQKPWNLSESWVENFLMIMGTNKSEEIKLTITYNLINSNTWQTHWKLNALEN